MAGQRRGAGVVERDGLENRCTGNRTVGSNPTLSAKPQGLSISSACSFASDHLRSGCDPYELQTNCKPNFSGMFFGRVSALSYRLIKPVSGIRRLPAIANGSSFCESVTNL
jgi:hypothetical protein